MTYLNIFNSNKFYNFIFVYNYNVLIQITQNIKYFTIFYAVVVAALVNLQQNQFISF